MNPATIVSRVWSFDPDPRVPAQDARRPGRRQAASMDYPVLTGRRQPM